MRSSLVKFPTPRPARDTVREPEPHVAAQPEKSRNRTAINTSPDDGFVFASSPSSAAAQRYRKMCAEIVSRSWPRKLMLVTSPSSGDGKTITAVNLAFALAERQKSVLLLELALERPRFRYVFGGPPSGKGIESILRGNAYPTDVIGQLGDSGIAIAEVNAASESEMLLNDNPLLDRFLKYAETHYDWTVIDAPDVSSSRAVKTLALAVQPVIMVVRSNHTGLDSLHSAIATLDRRVNYVIMNDERR